MDTGRTDATIRALTLASVAENCSNQIDAFRYAILKTVKTLYADPPPTPKGLTPEQHAAHLALHGLLSIEEFEAERQKAGFIQVNEHWGVNEDERFCCERRVPFMEQRGFIDGKVFYSEPNMNAAWMAAIEKP